MRLYRMLWDLWPNVIIDLPASEFIRPRNRCDLRHFQIWPIGKITDLRARVHAVPADRRSVCFKKRYRSLPAETSQHDCVSGFGNASTN